MDTLLYCTVLYKYVLGTLLYCTVLYKYVLGTFVNRKCNPLNVSNVKLPQRQKKMTKSNVILNILIFCRVKLKPISNMDHLIYQI